MAETAEQGWQPARFRQVHKMTFTDKANELFCKTSVIHIRKGDGLRGILLSDLQALRTSGCTSEEFFWIREVPGCWVCACEILTD